MMARRSVLGMLASAAVFVLGACGMLDSKASYRFRMTVEVATPQGLKTGSSVFEVKAIKNNTRIIATERPGSTRTFGQAVMVDTPSGTLFVLNNSPSETLGAVAARALKPGAPRNGPGDFVALVRDLGSAGEGGFKAELPRKDWPMIVRFADIDDPKSVEKVDPETAGVRRIALATTEEPVTTGIEKKLGWLFSHRGSLVKRPRGDSSAVPKFGHQVTEMDFSSEIGK